MRGYTVPVDRGGETARRVIEFVARERGSRPEAIHEDSDLWEDLGLAGDDVDEFFLAFSEEFGVPLKGTPLKGCFPGEGWILFWPQEHFFKPTRRYRVRELIEAAGTGRWPRAEPIVGRQ